MTTLTDTQVITASGGLVELGYSSKTSAVTVSSGYPGNDLGLSVTAVCDGSPVLVEFSSPSLNTGTTSGSGVGITLIMDGSDQAILGNLQNPGSGSLQSGCRFAYRMTPSAGSHTFTVKAYQGTSNGTVQAGVGGTGNYQPMWLRVSKIVQATQWPAVTTGTIICTSSTRPASPFAGQTIYETDNSRQLVWNGAAWVAPSITYRPPMCLVSRSATQSINNATDTAAAFTAGATFDTNGMFSSGANTKITIKTAGVYLVTLAVSFAANATGERFANVRLNNNVARPLLGSGGTTAGATRFSGASPLSLAVNDELTLNLFQTSGGALNVDGIEMSAIWQGQP